MGDLYVKGELIGNTRCDDALADSDNPVKNTVLNTHLNNNTTLTTTSKSVVGAINELKAEKAGQFTTMPEPSATYANGAIYLYIGVTTTTAPIYTHGISYECQEVTPATTPATFEWVEAGGGGSVSEWGDIGGTLSNQTDLQDALDDKQNKVFYGDTEPTTAVEGDLWVTADAISSTLKQTIYDIAFPIGKKIFDDTPPTVPDGVVATWSVNTSYDGKAIWIDSTHVGENVDGSLPDLEGEIQLSPYSGTQSQNINVEAATGVFTTGSNSTNTYYQTNVTCASLYSYPRPKFKASLGNSVYSASAGTNVVRPTGKCFAAYVRTA